MIIKALAPLLGTFSGRGEIADGTEMAAHFNATEIIPNLCYGMRLEVANAETGDHAINAYIVVSASKSGGDISLHLIDAKESFADLKRIENHSDNHAYAFQAVRDSGGLYRIEFVVHSAEQFDLSVSVSSRSESNARQLWTVHFDRQHRTLSLGEADADQTRSRAVSDAA